MFRPIALNLTLTQAKTRDALGNRIIGILPTNSLPYTSYNNPSFHLDHQQQLSFRAKHTFVSSIMRTPSFRRSGPGPADSHVRRLFAARLPI